MFLYCKQWLREKGYILDNNTQPIAVLDTAKNFSGTNDV